MPLSLAPVIFKRGSTIAICSVCCASGNWTCSLTISGAGDGNGPGPFGDEIDYVAFVKLVLSYALEAACEVGLTVVKADFTRYAADPALWDEIGRIRQEAETKGITIDASFPKMLPEFVAESDKVLPRKPETDVHSKVAGHLTFLETVVGRVAIIAFSLLSILGYVWYKCDSIWGTSSSHGQALHPKQINNSQDAGPVVVPFVDTGPPNRERLKRKLRRLEQEFPGLRFESDDTPDNQKRNRTVSPTFPTGVGS